VKKSVYQAPELQFVGEASEVVLGVEGVGGDPFGQEDWIEQEFAEN
jgi:hypothetical protein